MKQIMIALSLVASACGSTSTAPSAVAPPPELFATAFHVTHAASAPVTLDSTGAFTWHINPGFTVTNDGASVLTFDRIVGTLTDASGALIGGTKFTNPHAEDAVVTSSFPLPLAVGASKDWGQTQFWSTPTAAGTFTVEVVAHLAGAAAQTARFSFSVNRLTSLNGSTSFLER